MAAKTWASTDYMQRTGWYIAKIVQEDERGRWSTTWQCEHRNAEHADVDDALECGRRKLVDSAS